MEENKIVEVGSDGEVIDSNLNLVFKIPYTFEGKIYDHLDLTGLNSMNAADMLKVSKIVNASTPLLQEMSLEYAIYFASRATGMPIEFFKQMRPRDAIRLKNKITSFFTKRIKSV